MAIKLSSKKNYKKKVMNYYNMELPLLSPQTVFHLTVMAHHQLSWITDPTRSRQDLPVTTLLVPASQASSDIQSVRILLKCLGNLVQILT